MLKGTLFIYIFYFLFIDLFILSDSKIFVNGDGGSLKLPVGYGGNVCRMNYE